MKFGNFVVTTPHNYVCVTILSPDDQQSVNLVDILPNKMIIPSGMLQFLGNIGQGQ